MVLAIEDYNLSFSPDIQAGLILWWSSWTRRDHVVVITRADPPFLPCRVGECGAR
jgi:hypothetical protein